MILWYIFVYPEFLLLHPGTITNLIAIYLKSKSHYFDMLAFLGSNRIWLTKTFSLAVVAAVVPVVTYCDWKLLWYINILTYMRCPKNAKVGWFTHHIDDLYTYILSLSQDDLPDFVWTNWHPHLFWCQRTSWLTIANHDTKHY